MGGGVWLVRGESYLVLGGPVVGLVGLGSLGTVPLSERMEGMGMAFLSLHSLSWKGLR